MGHSIVILEDDLIFSIKLRKSIEAWGHTVIGVYSSGKFFFDDLNKLNPSLVILKIDLKGLCNGIKIVNVLKHMNIPTIFITSNKEKQLFETARKANGVAYLIRPFDMLTLRSIIEFPPMLISHGREKNYSNTLFIKKRGEFKKILISNIAWIKSDQNYCTIYVNHQVFTEKISLKKLLSKLNSPFLLKINRSHVINVNFITNASQKNNTVSISENVFSVSRNYKKELIKFINELN